MSRQHGLERWPRILMERLREIWESADRVARTKAVETVEAEFEEMEMVFAVLVQGAFIGLPSPPVQISLDLLPDMESEMIMLLDRVDTVNEPLSRLFSVFDVS